MPVWQILNTFSFPKIKSLKYCALMSVEGAGDDGLSSQRIGGGLLHVRVCVCFVVLCVLCRVVCALSCMDATLCAVCVCMCVVLCCVYVCCVVLCVCNGCS